MLSYSRGPDQELWELTIGQVLDRGVERWGDSLALVSCHQSKRYTWRELRDAADAVARGLASLGIRRGDRVGLWSTNCAEWMLVHLGCARAGAVLVNVNPAYRTHELAFTLQKSRMKILFLSTRSAGCLTVPSAIFRTAQYLYVNELLASTSLGGSDTSDCVGM